MVNRAWEVRLIVHAPSAREAVEELGGRSSGWLDDVVTRVTALEMPPADESLATFDPADHPLSVRL